MHGFSFGKYVFQRVYEEITPSERAYGEIILRFSPRLRLWNLEEASPSARCRCAPRPRPAPPRPASSLLDSSPEGCSHLDKVRQNPFSHHSVIWLADQFEIAGDGRKVSEILISPLENQWCSHRWPSSGRSGFLRVVIAFCLWVYAGMCAAVMSDHETLNVFAVSKRTSRLLILTVTVFVWVSNWFRWECWTAGTKTLFPGCIRQHFLCCLFHLISWWCRDY